MTPRWPTDVQSNHSTRTGNRLPCAAISAPFVCLPFAMPAPASIADLYRRLWEIARMQAAPAPAEHFAPSAWN